MNRRIGAASLSAALAAAVLVGGTAQAYAAAASPAPAHAAPAHAAPAPVAAPAVQEGASAQALDIWHWVGRYNSQFAAEAAYWVLYGLGSAIAMRIEKIWDNGVETWELYIQ
ncbi:MULTISPECIES: hypothetical protein [Streptomycetaceae]|uniref:hypothetical protein n=1 Tax=Streptomycetaceae TaxID=2062 RepID=UPI00093EECEF|nr:hypothetical protein [Streptomyces sp. CB02056]OKI01577.1 hypothetical protein AMK13_32430 [Streptomyces sp. CB02056]